MFCLHERRHERHIRVFEGYTQGCVRARITARRQKGALVFGKIATALFSPHRAAPPCPPQPPPPPSSRRNDTKTYRRAHQEATRTLTFVACAVVEVGRQNPPFPRRTIGAARRHMRTKKNARKRKRTRKRVRARPTARKRQGAQGFGQTLFPKSTTHHRAFSHAFRETVPSLASRRIALKCAQRSTREKKTHMCKTTLTFVACAIVEVDR